jgi:hypothetical protein
MVSGDEGFVRVLSISNGLARWERHGQAEKFIRTRVSLREKIQDLFNSRTENYRRRIV